MLLNLPQFLPFAFIPSSQVVLFFFLVWDWGKWVREELNCTAQMHFFQVLLVCQHATNNNNNKKNFMFVATSNSKNNNNNSCCLQISQENRKKIQCKHTRKWIKKKEKKSQQNKKIFSEGKTKKNFFFNLFLNSQETNTNKQQLKGGCHCSRTDYVCT